MIESSRPLIGKGRRSCCFCGGRPVVALWSPGLLESAAGVTHCPFSSRCSTRTLSLDGHSGAVNWVPNQVGDEIELSSGAVRWDSSKAQGTALLDSWSARRSVRAASTEVAGRCVLVCVGALDVALRTTSIQVPR